MFVCCHSSEQGQASRDVPQLQQEQEQKQERKACKQHLRSRRDLGTPADFLYHLVSALVCVFSEMCVYVSVEYMRDAGEALFLLQKLSGIVLCLQQALGASCP